MKIKLVVAPAARDRDAARRPQADLGRTEWQKFAGAAAGAPRAARSPGIFRR